MKLLWTAAPLTGHLNPVLALGRIFEHAGHEVLVMMPSSLRKNVEAAGLRYVPSVTADEQDFTDLGAC